MTDIVEKKHSRLLEQLAKVKNDLFTIKEQVHSKRNEFKMNSDDAKDKIRLRVIELRIESEKHREELENSLSAVSKDFNLITARNHAEKAETYATACINVAFAAVEEAQHAVSAALDAADKLEDAERRKNEKA